MQRRVVKCEKRAPRNFRAQRFITFVATRKSRMELLRSHPAFYPTPGTTESATHKTGLQGRGPPASDSLWGLLETVTPQIAALAIPVPFLFFNFRTGSENIELRHVTRYMCTNSRARERHVLSFMARCKCFLSRFHGKTTDRRILTSREQDVATGPKER